MTKLIPAALVSLAILSGCGSDSGTEPQTGRDIKISTSINGMTRVANNVFQKNDKISVYAYIQGSSPKEFRFDNNVHTTADGANWTNTTRMEWLTQDEGKTFDFFAIHPADLNAMGANLGNYNFTLSGTLSNDLLVASTPGITVSNTTAALAFNHIMSKLIINLSYKNEFQSTPTVDKVDLLGLNTKATIDFFAKSFSALSTPATITPAVVTANESYSTIVIPQVVASGAQMVQIKIGSKNYNFIAPNEINLKTNKETTMNLSVGANGIITLGTVTVSDWGEKEDIEGDAPEA